MILSHKHKFIYFKTTKTAGTSTELALAPYCGENDVVTQVSFGERSMPHGHKHPVRNTTIKNDGKTEFVNHMNPVRVRRLIIYKYGKERGEEIWNTYHKITNIRNPWSRVVSYWCYDIQSSNNLDANQSPLEDTFEEYVHNKKTKTGYRKIIHPFYEWVTVDSQVCIDRFIRFEHLQSDINQLFDDLNLPKSILPTAKARVRKRTCGVAPYQEFYNSETKQIVYDIFEDDIKYFNYEFR